MKPCEHFTVLGNGSRRSVTAFFPERTPSIMQATAESHPHFESIIKGLNEGDPHVYDLFDVEAGMNRKFEQLTDHVSVRGGKVYRDLVPVDDVIADHIVRFLDEGLDDYKPLVKFMDKIAANPSEHSRAHLYRWLKSKDFTINDEGNIVAYKGVHVVEGDEGKKYQSTRSGPAVVNGKPINDYVPNEPGSVIQMPRDQVTFDPAVTCSSGLHVGTWDYASTFVGSNGAVLEVEVDPADFVSVPVDANGSKGRVWRYKVTRVVDRPYATALKPAEDYYSYDEYEEEEEWDPDSPDYF